MPDLSKVENLSHKLIKEKMDIATLQPLRIEYVKVDDIYPNDYNPNMHTADSFDLLVKSLLLFGFTMPIVVNRNTMQIVDGENRYRAASIIGYELVPVCFVDWDEEKTKYATIIHNMARGKNNDEMMDRLLKYLDDNFENDSSKVLLQSR